MDHHALSGNTVLLFRMVHVNVVDQFPHHALGDFRGVGVAEVSTPDEQGQNQKKAVIKGARLRLYPPGFNLYRSSRGVKRPEVWQTTEAEAQAVIQGASLTYEKTIAVTDEAGDVKNIINYRQYNIAAKEDGPLDAAEKAIPPQNP